MQTVSLKSHLNLLDKFGMMIRKQYQIQSKFQRSATNLITFVSSSSAATIPEEAHENQP
ncbi:hypothetical protein Plhal304r1_c073g0161381 [Plasmopara halstedii]